ncbi:hypothetical protein A9Q83_15300 [Alphaproteobacteria bacterium 46_93_T64]|nr:hypothetical protein A9Q83_15300 [Alphaproteobacteria bacterium 46_93_T64]
MTQNTTTQPHLFCFGFGFTASEVARQNSDWQISGTTRHESDLDVAVPGVQKVLFDGVSGPADFDRIADTVTHILVSVPPTEAGDCVCSLMATRLAKIKSLQWVGYLSTTGVYGDLQGGTATEDTPLNPSGARGQRRVDAESQWQAAAQIYDLPLHIFRLPGIYGQGRNQMVSLKNGKAHRIVKKDHVFSRIHVNDLAMILSASMKKPNPGQIYNVSDDFSAPPEDVVTYAAELLTMDPPPLQEFEAAELSPMARSFYSDNKRISNDRIKKELGITLRYPTYKIGLKALSERL